MLGLDILASVMLAPLVGATVRGHEIEQVVIERAPREVESAPGRPAGPADPAAGGEGNPWSRAASGEARVKRMRMRVYLARDRVRIEPLAPPHRGPPPAGRAATIGASRSSGSTGA